MSAKRLKLLHSEDWPGSFVVEEEDEEEVLPGFLGHLLPEFQHV